MDQEEYALTKRTTGEKLSGTRGSDDPLSVFSMAFSDNLSNVQRTADAETSETVAPGQGQAQEKGKTAVPEVRLTQSKLRFQRITKEERRQAIERASQEIEGNAKKTTSNKTTGGRSRGRKKKTRDDTQRHKTRTTQQALQFQTQNLQGFSKKGTTITEWFDSFRERHSGGMVDAVFVQETRAHGHWPETLAAQYENGWGFTTGALETPLSYWSTSAVAAGGVAILLHPKTELQNAHPLWPELWTPHFIAVQATHDGQAVTLVCVYGPTVTRERECLYDQLAQLPTPEGAIVIGGDFNCTQDPELDRTRTTTKNYSSAALERWLQAWDLLDGTVTDALAAQTAGDIAEYRATHHTFHYGYGDGKSASCRLDRFYVDRGSVNRVISIEQAVPALRVDHQAVYMQLSHQIPRRLTKTRRQVLRYPLARCATEGVAAVSTAILRSTKVAEADSASESIAAWDALKVSIRTECLREVRHRLKLSTATYRRRVFRLRLALRSATRGRRQGPATVPLITANMEQLSLDSHERIQSIRRSLIDIRRQHLARRQRAKFAQYAGRGPLSTRAFYKRISIKFTSRRAAALPADSTRPSSLADRLAQDWQPITQQAPQDPELQDQFFSQLPDKHQKRLQDIDEDFTEEEIRRAIKSCPRRKACGPDGLPNDWYRDHVDVLPQILAPMFTQWHRASQLPRSFKQATVYCIPKSAQPQSGLDFRPIALLNTDYKIYARCLLNRVRHHLIDLVSETQFGFVPGRQVHDAIDLWTASRRLVLEGQVDSTACVLLLDFAKAYDTLDRQFLLRAIRRHGFSEMFVAAVGAMHLATSATYLADASESAEYDITTGIRQGCPLAPVLFILALDTLYELVTHDRQIQGVQLTDAVSLKIAGFADDTSLYLSRSQEVDRCVELLDIFRRASGLRVNLTKSHGLYLHPQGRQANGPTVLQLSFMDTEQLLRHLGAQIATTPSRATIWELTLQQLRARLALAEVKTLNLQQRVQICKAVILPKLLFVGRHSWPTRATIDKLQRLIQNYAWRGVLAYEKQPGRAWMNVDAAALPEKDGGLALPVLLQEFEALGAKIAARWALSTTPVRTATGAVMLWKPHLGRHAKIPLPIQRGPVAAPRYGDTPAATGISVIRAATTQPRTEEERAGVQQAWLGGRGSSAATRWEAGWWHTDQRHRQAALAHLSNLQCATHGVFQLEALLRATLDESVLLIDEEGQEMRSKDFGGAAPAGLTIGDILQVERHDDWTVRWYYKLRPHPMPTSIADGFRDLCDALVCNYPTLVLPQSPDDFLHAWPQTLARWRVGRQGAVITLTWEPQLGAAMALGAVATLDEAARRARTVDATFGRFLQHPWFSSTTTIWASATSAMTPKTYKTLVTKEARQRGLLIAASKLKRSVSESPPLAAALQQLTWQRIQNLSHATSAQRLVLYRLKHMRLGGWDRLHSHRGCPHCPELGSTAATSFHTAWHCHAAQKVWAGVREFWAKLETWTTTETTADFRAACISLKLLRIPARVWQLPSLRGSHQQEPAQVVAVYGLLNELWQRHCLLALQLIWRWRCGLHDPDTKWSESQVLALWQSGCQVCIRVMLDQQKDHKSATGAIELLAALSSFDCEPQPLPPALSITRYVLFFDGGSRGNPGPGGAGAVIVATDDIGATGHIVWAAAMSYARMDMTNNRAEYLGAIAGLRAALAQEWRPLDVVGDSALILRQLQEYRPPRNAQLLPLYAQARVLADKIGVTRWCHHYRAHNKMADAAANIAMDARASLQVLYPTVRKDLQVLDTHLASDLHQWQITIQAREQRLSLADLG